MFAFGNGPEVPQKISNSMKIPPSEIQREFSSWSIQCVIFGTWLRTSECHLTKCTCKFPAILGQSAIIPSAPGRVWAETDLVAEELKEATEKSLRLATGQMKETYLGPRNPASATRVVLFDVKI